MRRAVLARLLGASTLLVVLYYIVPVEPGDSAWRLVARIVSAVLCVAGATVLIVRQVRKQMNVGDDEPPLAGLAIALVAGLVAFAMTDYLIAYSDPTEFAELTTRTDALYFALSTLLTVGYGDVHAVGQLARAVVIIQMAFNIVILATGASLLANQLSDRVRRRRRPAAAGPPAPPAAPAPLAAPGPDPDPQP
jgi:voltage-gated potassium channel